MAYPRYKPENVILPYEKFPSYQQIEKIEPYKSVQPYTPYYGWDDERRTIYQARQNKQTQTFLANYNDPTELNSFIDALTNRAAVSKKFGDAYGTFSTATGAASTIALIAAGVAALIPGGQPVAAGLAATAGVLATPSIPAMADVAIEKGIKPILAGKPQEAGLNMLMNLGETLDVAANPIKGLILEGPQGFVKGTGLFSNEGRVNYDFNTGSTIADIALEILVDPLTYVDFGVTAAAKSIAKSTVKPVVRNVTREISKSVERLADRTFIKETGIAITKTFTDDLEAQLTKTASKLARTYNSTLSKNLTDEFKEDFRNTAIAQLQQTITRTLRKHFPKLTETDIAKIFTATGRDARTGRFTKSIKANKLLENNVTLDSLTSEVLRNVSAIQRGSDTLQRAAFRGALYTSGFGLGFLGLKGSWNAIKTWQAKSILRNLVKPGYFDVQRGVDLARYDEAKQAWLQQEEYYTLIGEQVAPRDLSNFLGALNIQLTRDQALIASVLQDNKTALTKSAALDGKFKELYGFTFDDYIQYLEHINVVENNSIKHYVKFAKDIKRLISNLTVVGGSTKVLRGTLKGSPNFIKDLEKLATDNANTSAEKFYTIQYNLENTVEALVYDPRLAKHLIAATDTSVNLGAFIENAISDPASLGLKSSAELDGILRELKAAIDNFAAVRKFYDEVDAMPLPEIEGVKAVKFKQYLRDELFGFEEPIKYLLDNFDEYTMPMLMQKLEMLLYSEGFSAAKYPGLQDIIAPYVKSILQDMNAAGVATHLSNTFPENFTSNLSKLRDYLRKQAYDVNIDKAIGDVLISFAQLNAIKQMNRSVAEIIIPSTLFDKFKDITITRYLSDAGFGLRAVGTQEDIKFFRDITSDIMPATFKELLTFGRRINYIKARFEQFDVFARFTEEDATALRELYSEVYKRYLKDVEERGELYTNTFLSDNDLLRFAYLKEDYTDIADIAAILIEFKNAITQLPDKKLLSELHALVSSQLKNNQLRNLILYPESALKTTYAMDAMKFSRWAAKQALREEHINMNNAWRALGKLPGKVASDFKNMRKQLSDTGLDRPKAIQLERYQRMLMKIEKFFDELELEFNSRFDKQVAQKQIENLRKFVNEYPHFAEKYSALIDKLEGYWNGTVTFKQPAKSQTPEKYMQRKAELTERYRASGFTPEQLDYMVESKLAEEFPEGIVDEFTPFWEEVRKMNADYIQAQLKGIHEENLKDYVTTDFLRYLDNNPTKKADLLDILVNPDRVLSSEDYDIYYDFIDSYSKRNAHKKVELKESDFADERYAIPYELIPASFKKLDFVFLHDVLNITEPRAVYYHPDSMGYTTRARPDAVTARLTNKGLRDVKATNKNYTKFDLIRSTYLHEAAHSVFSRLFKGANDDETLQNIHHYLENTFKPKFINAFGEETFNGFKRVLQTYPGYASDVYLEEMFTHSIANEWAARASNAKCAALGVTRPPQEELTAFAESLKQDLIELAAPLREEIKESFSKINFDREKSFYGRPVEVITPWDPFREQQELYKAINAATIQNSQNTLRSLFNQSPEEFVQDLAAAHGVMTFLESDIGDKSIRPFFEKMQKALDDKVHFVKVGERWWVVIDKSQKIRYDGRQIYLNTIPVMHTNKPRTFNEFTNVDAKLKSNKLHITETLNSMEKDLEDLTGSRLGYSSGENFNADTAKQLYNQMPDEVKKLIDEEEFTKSDNYGAYHYNNTILGTPQSKADANIYFGGNALINMRNAYVQSSGYVKAKTEYVHTVFDSALSIGSPNSIWKEYSDEALLKALQQNPDYCLCTLTENKKWGIKVVELPPTNIDVIKKAREYGAVILPRQVAKDMFNVVNHRLGSTGFAKLWNRLIYLFKFGYLLRPGAWIRNFIDTNIKSYLEMGDDYKSYINQAHVILDEFERVKDFAAKRSQNSDGILTNEIIKEYFDLGLNKNLTYEQFQELNQKVFQQGIAQNIMADLYRGQGGEFWQSMTYYSGKIIDSVNKTEHYNRLATYLYYLDRGYDNTHALSKLAKVHFDYTFKTEAEQLAEMIFPFTTFTLRNFSYWVEMAEKHPWIMRNYVHLMKPSWDFQDYTPEELALQRRVQNQIIYGQLKLAEFNDKIVTFKANPSIQDALQMFSDPINNIYDKLAAPASIPIELAQGQNPNVLNLIPAIGPTINDISQSVKSGSPVPSAIGVYKTPKHTGQTAYQSPYSLSVTDQYRDKTYRTPRYYNNYYYDHYRTYGATRYRNNFYPIVDIAHEIKMRYSINVYNRIKNRIHKDPQDIIRWRIRQDANRFRNYP